MTDRDWLTKCFDENRAHLRAVAYRMLGSQAEAEDATQEAWIRLNRTDTSQVDNLGGWLTTVVARVCLDMLRTRKSRGEQPLIMETPAASDPEDELALASSIGPALLVVLETLGPAERVAFVLHDMFDLSFDEIAPIVGRTPHAARQLASRARRRVQGAETPAPDVARHREMVSAFLAASRGGDLQALLAVLAPDVIVRADQTAVDAASANPAAPPLLAEARGAAAVAGMFQGRARGATPALIDGDAGAVWAVEGHPRAAFVFGFAGDRIAEIHVVMSPDALAALDLEIA